MTIRELSQKHWDRKHAQRLLHESMQDQLIFAHSNGMWRANRELIAFLSAFQHTNHLVVEDIYGVPRTVNPQELLEQACQRYQSAANAWAVAWADLAKVRKAADV